MAPEEAVLGSGVARVPVAERTKPVVWVAVIAIAIIAFAGILEPLIAMTHTISAGYDEGWNAFWADAALTGGGLYPPPQAVVSNNYPPLSFFLVGALGRLIGDNIIAGRIVSLASMTVVAWAIFAWLRIVRMPRQIAAAGAAIFLASFAAYARSYVAFDDPQLLGHAIMLCGLVLVWRGRASARATALAAVIMTLGGFTKHLLLPLPAATTLWIAIWHRKRLGQWLFAVSGTAGILLLATGLAYGTDFFKDIFAGRAYNLALAKRTLLRACRYMFPMLVLTCVAGLSGQRAAEERPTTFFVIAYAAFAALIGTIAASGEGVDINAFFDLLIAASLGAALGLRALQAGVGRATATTLSDWRALAAIWTTAGFLALSVAQQFPAELTELAQLSAGQVATEADLRFLSRFGREHAACAEPALCYWAGSGFAVDFFNLGQKIKIGSLPGSTCERLFGMPGIDVVQLTSRAELDTGLCNRLLRERFTQVRESMNGIYLVRKPMSR